MAGFSVDRVIPVKRSIVWNSISDFHKNPSSKIKIIVHNNSDASGSGIGLVKTMIYKGMSVEIKYLTFSH